MARAAETTYYTPERIEQIRETLGLTKPQMCAEMGITVRHYQFLTAPPETQHHRNPSGSVVKLLQGLEHKAKRLEARWLESKPA